MTRDEGLLTPFLRALFGRRITRQNPPRVRRRSNPGGSDLDKAVKMSEEFHGTGKEVVILSDSEMRPPSKYQMVVGELVDISYEVAKDSNRYGDGTPFLHKAGDVGPLGIFGKKGPGKSLVTADPETGIVRIIPNRSGMTFSPEEGILA